VLAAIRPAGQDFPLLLHIVGATLAFGALLASASFIALARGQARLLRLGYFSLLLVALPGRILMNRPIVVTPLGVRLCRPSETVKEILPK